MSGLQSIETLAVGILFSLILALVLSIGFYFTVNTEKSKPCVRSCPFTLWGIANSFTTIVRGILDIFYTLLGFITIKSTFTALMLIVASVACFQYHEQVLRITDDAWRTSVYPILYDVLEPLILLFRFFYNILNPLYNLYIGAMYQLTRGSTVIISKCAVDGLYDPLRHIGNATIHTAEGTVVWLKDTSRPVDIVQGLHDIGMAIHTTQNGLKCACKQTEIFTDVALYGPSLPDFAHGANSFINVPIQLTKDLVTAAFVGSIQMPTFKHTFAFFNDGMIKSSVGFDKWLFYALSKYGIVDRSNAPEQGVISALGRSFVAAISIPQDVVSGALDLLNAPTDTQIRENFGFKSTWRNLEISTHAIGESLYFFIEQYNNRIAGAPYVPYDCEWDEEQEFIHLGKALGCGAEHFLKPIVGLPHVIWSTTINSIWRSVGDDVLTILQKHDGRWLKKTGLLTCEYRKEHSVDYSVTPPESPLYTIVDPTTDASKCVCEVDSYLADPIKGYKYDPFCSQPTLQAQVFNPMDSAVIFVSRGLFGPLAGVANAPARLIIETARIFTHLVLSAPSIAESGWANRQLDCGYGIAGNTCDEKYSFQTGSKKCLNNANGDCFCDYTKPIEFQSQCQCIATYPVTTTTFEETQNVDTLFQKASPRWCNTQLFEHSLNIIETTGHSFAYVFDWLGKGVNVLENRGRRCYNFELAAMSTTAALGGDASGGQACNVWGHHNVFCGLGGSTKAFARLATNVARQAITNVFFVLQGNIDDLELDLSQRICDLERTGSMLASSLSGSLIFAQFPQRESVAKLLFALEGVVTVPVKIIHRIYYSIVQILETIRQSAMSGNFDSDKITNTFKTLIIDCVRTVFDSVKLGLTAMEQFFDSIVRGGGKVFATLRDAMEGIESALTSSFLDILTEITNIILQFISIISGKTSFGGGIVSMLKSIAKILGEFISIASNNIMILLESLLSLLGPFGDILKTIAGTLCNIVKDIASLPVISVLGGGDSIQCFDGGRRLSIAGNPPVTVTKWANKVFNWTGTSVCDIMMRETVAPLHELSTLERATWEECLTNRFIGEKIAEQVDIPELKLFDVAYNYQRKYFIGYEVFENLRLTFGVKRRIDAYHVFLDHHMNTRLHMALYDKLNEFSSRAWKAFEISVDDYSQQNMPEATASTLSKVMRSMRKFNTREWVNEKKTFWKSFEAVPHLMNISVDGHNPFTLVANQWKQTEKIVEDVSEEFTGAPLFTDISGDDGISQCTIIDNFFEMLVSHGENIGRFYSIYIPETIADFETYGQKPSFESKWESNNMTGASFNTGAEIDRWGFARKDWETLFDGHRLNRDDVQGLIDATAGFLTRTNNSYVPYFGIGIPYIIIYPLFESCDIESAIFVNEEYEGTRGRAERIAAVGQGIQNAVVYALLILYSNIWCPFPVGVLNSYILLLTVMWFIYAFTVYGSYLPTCWPNVPYTAMDDLYAWIRLNRANEHFCNYMPLLYPGDCGSVAGDAPVYKSCDILISDFKKGEITEEGEFHFGTLWWPLLTFLRYNVGHLPPIAFVFGLFGNIPDALKQWEARFDVTDVELACMKVMFPTVLTTGMMLLFILYVSVKTLFILAQVAINAAVTTFQLYNTSVEIIEVLLEEEIEGDEEDLPTAEPVKVVDNDDNNDDDEEEEERKLQLQELENQIKGEGNTTENININF